MIVFMKVSETNQWLLINIGEHIERAALVPAEGGLSLSEHLHLSAMVLWTQLDLQSLTLHWDHLLRDIGPHQVHISHTNQSSITITTVWCQQVCCYLVQCDILGGRQQLVVQLWSWSWSWSWTSTLEELRSSVCGAKQDEEETAALWQNSETQEDSQRLHTTTEHTLNL